MNQYIQKILTAGLGAAALVLCTPAQHVFAAPAGNVVAEEAVSLTAKAETALTAPVPVAEAVGYDSVTVSWETVDGAAKYELQQSVDKKNYTTVAVLTPEQELRYTVGALYTAKTYYYRVVILDSEGMTAASEPLKVKTVLSAPTITKLESGAWDQIDIAWTAVDGADFYYIYRSTTQVGGYKNIKTVYGTSDTDQVTPGVTYYYKVMPMRNNPNGKKASGKCSDPRSAAACIGTPAISSVKSSAGNSLTVNWNSVPEADGYVVYRRTLADRKYQKVTWADGGCTSWTDTAVEAGTKYYYKIRSYKTISGKKTYSKLSGVKAGWTASAAPTDVEATQDGNGTVSLKWTPSKAATSYRVYRAVGTTGKYTRIQTKLTTCSYTDSGLTMGETYTYRVEAVHGSLVSEKSPEVSIRISTIKVNTRTLFLGPGVSAALSATTDLPGTVSWSSADPAIAAVSADGTVTGVAAGKTQIIASLDTIAVSVDVTVTDCQLNGIDVSKWQGDINWKTVKDSGIQFAMLRLAHGTSKDRKFEDYYAGALEQGIPVGIYCYSLAKSVQEGTKEAENLLKLLDGRALTYPIALDLEDASQLKNMSKKARTELILEYKRIIEEAGYRFVVYANLNWLNNYIDQTKLAEENVDIWIARYRSQSLGYGYEGGGNVRMWQYSSTGQVDGILDAYGRYINVDLDVCYDGY